MKEYPNPTKELCQHGCGNIGKYYSKRAKSWRCSKNVLSCPGFQKRKQAIMDEKYGGNPMKNKDIAKKCYIAAKNTIKKRYGVDNPSQIDGKGQLIAEKRKATLKERYGVEFPLQINDAKEKSISSRKATLKERYDVDNIFQVDTIKQKANENRKKIMLEKYGVTNPMDIIEIAEKAAANALKNKKKSQHEWLKEQLIPEAMWEKVIQLDDCYFIVDGYDPNTNTVYEFWGDYWHGNPNVYDSKEINPTSGKSFGELYEATINKKQKLIDSGYKVIDIWESEWKLRKQ